MLYLCQHLIYGMLHGSGFGGMLPDLSWSKRVLVALPRLESAPLLKCHGLVHHAGREAMLDSFRCLGCGMS